MDRRGSCGGDSILSIASFLLRGAGGFAIMGWGVRPLNNISRPPGLTVARVYKGTLLGTPNRGPQENSRNIMEYKGPGNPW